MKKILTAAGFLLLIALSAFGREGPLSLAADYACFRAGKAVRLEIYYALFSGELELVPAESLGASFRAARAGGGRAKSYALVLANVDLFTADGKAVDSLSKTTAFRVARPDTSNELAEMLVFDLSPGDYSARLEVVDLKTGRVGRDTVEVQAPDFASPGLKISGLQLARLILKGGGMEGLSFYRKGERQVIPNPAATYSLDDPRLYFYFEVYNLAPPERDLRSFEIQYGLVGGGGDTVKSSGYRKYRKEENPLVTGSIDIAALTPGEYSLFVGVRDPVSGQAAFQSKSFSLFPPSILPPVAREELDLFPQVTHFLLTPEEKEIYQSSNRTGKLNFIDQFWKKRDPTPETPENEFQKEAYARYWKALERFSQSASVRDGWKTDRGRVLMLYGEPNNVERHPAAPSLLPWERWEYTRIAGGRQAFFVFADLHGLGKLELVHSTAPGERQNPDWEELLQAGSLGR